MLGGPTLEIPLENLARQAAVADIVYNPLETRLIRDAAAAGCCTVLGLDMFIDQACAQFRRWTGLEAPADLMRAACLKRLG